MPGSFMVQQQPFITVQILDFQFIPVQAWKFVCFQVLILLQVVKFVVFYCLYLCAIFHISFLNLSLVFFSLFSLMCLKVVNFKHFQKLFTFFWSLFYLFLLVVCIISLHLFSCVHFYFSNSFMWQFLLFLFFLDFCFNNQTFLLELLLLHPIDFERYAFIFIYLKYTLISSLIFSLSTFDFLVVFLWLHLLLFLPFSSTN